jgi:tetratricopeptide (TPR) repeat protein
MTCRHRFLFFIERDFHIAMLTPLMEYIRSHNLGEIRLYAPFSQNIPHLLLQYLSFDVPIVHEPYSYQPDITFMCDFSYQYVEGLGRIVNIGHGTICKGWFYNKSKISQRENCADLICVPGAVHKERLRHQVYKPIVVTGMPKLDKCFDGSLSYQNIMHKFRLDPEQKTVLLAPTFNEEFSIVPYLQNIDLTKVFPDFINLIIKLHGVADDHIKDMFLRLQDKNRNVYIADTFNADEIFFVSDLMISDVSSVIYEFISLGKPVLLFDSQRQREYHNYNETDLEWEYRDVGFRFTDVNRIPQMIFKLFTSAKTKEVSEVAEKFISVRDGSSSEKVVKYALDMLMEKPVSEVAVLTDGITKEIEQKHRSRFEIVETDKNPFIDIVNIAKNTTQQYLLFIDSSYETSPQLASLLYNQIKNTPQAQLVVPFVDDNEIHFQHFRSRIRFANELNFAQSGIQLSYAFTGQSMDIDFIMPYCFLLDKSVLETIRFSDAADVRLCIHELLTAILQRGGKVLLAYDTLIIKKASQEITKPSGSLGSTNARTTSLATSGGDVSQALPQSREGQREVGNADYESFPKKSIAQQILESPNDESLILRHTKLCFEAGDWDQVDIYADMLPGSFEATYYKIKSLENQGFARDALNRILDVDFSKLNDTDLLVRLLTLKGRLLFIHNEVDDALMPLDVALQIDSSYIEALLTRGVFYISQGDMKSAIKDFDTILGIEPQHSRALTSKGVALQKSENYVKSTECFVTVLGIEPFDMEAINGIVVNAWMTRDFAIAMEVLEIYLQAHSENVSIMFTLAAIHYETGEHIKSMTLLRKIQSIDANFPGVTEMIKNIQG